MSIIVFKGHATKNKVEAHIELNFYALNKGGKTNVEKLKCWVCTDDW